MKYTIILTSTSQKSLDIYIRYFEIMFKKLNIQNSTFSLPTTKKKITLLKSPHVYKKAKEHFEMRTYRKKVIFDSFNNLSMLKVLLSNKPKSVKLKLHYDL